MTDNEKQVKPTKRLSSLTAFVPENVDVQIEYPDRIEVVPMRTISYIRSVEINQGVADPTPPVHHVDPNTKLPVFDYKDPGYQQAMYTANTDRMFRMIVEMLKLDIPGETVDEKVAYLKTLDAAFIAGIFAAVNELTKRGEAQLLAKAQTFQPVGSSGTNHLSANGLVDAAVATAFGG